MNVAQYHGFLLVRNVDWFIDHTAFYELFSLCGHVLLCSLPRRRPVTSCGYVLYESELSARRAVSRLDRRRVGNKELNVVSATHLIKLFNWLNGDWFTEDGQDLYIGRTVEPFHLEVACNAHADFWRVWRVALVLDREQRVQIMLDALGEQWEIDTETSDYKTVVWVLADRHTSRAELRQLRWVRS
eukprot:TRINITY_DN55392_c0_g1_i1.p1 TRINITY_DN55392_c0_g1~~TRINITY_DN55392_c0_g1_i1.p1  ORF type:complete len:186 (-),score=19.94 TRINITY_DN55392_c0_g1_i1:22-579(-)